MGVLRKAMCKGNEARVFVDGSVAGERRLLLNTALRMVRGRVVRDEICFAHQSTAGGEGL